MTFHTIANIAGPGTHHTSGTYHVYFDLRSTHTDVLNHVRASRDEHVEEAQR